MADTVRSTALERALDDLYAAAPAEFVLVRSALERELRQSGETDAAAEIRRRRRPHLAAWACNQLTRRDPDGVAALIDATKRLADAQRGAGTAARGDELRRLGRARHEMLGGLAGAAVELLRGYAPKPETYSDNITATLDAASVDDEVAQQLRAGRLTQALTAPASFGPPPVGPLPVGPPVAAPARGSARERDRARRELEKARKTVTQLSREVEAAAAEQASAGIDAEAVASHTRDVEQALDRAREQAEHAGRRVLQARERAERLRRDVADALEDVRESEERLREIEAG